MVLSIKIKDLKILKIYLRPLIKIELRYPTANKLLRSEVLPRFNLNPLRWLGNRLNSTQVFNKGLSSFLTAKLLKMAISAISKDT